MFAFYAVRGYKLNDFLSLTEVEKTFLYCAMETYYEEETEKLKIMAGRG